MAVVRKFWTFTHKMFCIRVEIGVHRKLETSEPNLLFRIHKLNTIYVQIPIGKGVREVNKFEFKSSRTVHMVCNL